MSRNLVHDLEARAREDGERIALLFEDGRAWTFAELDDAAARVADELRQRGVRQGDRVGIHLRNSPELVLALTGCWKAGAVPVPMSGLYTPAEVAQCVTKTGPALLIADPGVLGIVGPDGADGLPGIPASSLAAALETASTSRASPRQQEPTPMPEGDEEGLILFTGGSTGEPKAVSVTHAGTHASMATLARAQKGSGAPEDTMVPMTPPAVGPNLVLLPLFHGGGIQSLLFAWHVGRAVLLVERFSVDRVARLVPLHRVDNLFLLPTMVHDLTHAESDVDLSSVGKVLVAGQRLDPLLKTAFEKRYGIIVMSNYGSAELGHVAGWNARDVREGRWKQGSVGRVYDGVELEVRDDRGQAVPVGSTGEIWVKSSRTKGYVGPGGAGAETADLISDGWVRSGDVGYVDDDRVLFLVGRTRELIKTGGFQVWPAEIEEVLRQHPAVADVAVVGVTDQRLGEIPKAFVVPRHPLDPAELITWCRDRLAHFKAIRAVAFVEELPRSEAGKVKRSELQARHERPPNV